MSAFGIILLIFGLFMLNWVGRQYAKSAFDRPMLFHNVWATLIIQVITWGSLIAGIIITALNTPWILGVFAGVYLLLLLFSKKKDTVKSKAEKICSLFAQNRIKLGLYAPFEEVVKLSVDQYASFYNWSEFEKRFAIRHILEESQDALRIGDWSTIGSKVLSQEYHNQQSTKHNGSIDYLLNDQVYKDLQAIDIAVKEAADKTIKQFKAK